MDIINLKEKENFKAEGRGFATLVNEPYLQVNQVCLESGQHVPSHEANSNVTLKVVYGEGMLTVGNESINIVPGKLFRIPRRSLMSISNEFPGRLAFLVFKTPHPDAMKD
ncbi:MAG: hypothetical protein L7F78_06915 [Syntrophales bacterium LBB04]|nr:hypothetical protein [Syntrophales bacterium LBB04]